MQVVGNGWDGMIFHYRAALWTGSWEHRSTEWVKKGAN